MRIDSEIWLVSFGRCMSCESNEASVAGCGADVGQMFKYVE